MSAKSCCVKVKNCSGKLSGMAESQMFLIEESANFSPELEKEIAEFWDKVLYKAEKIQQKLFDAQ